MESCYCCEKECAPELLKSDDASDETKFCPDCFSFKLKCESNGKYYVSCRYDPVKESREFDYRCVTDEFMYDINNWTENRDNFCLGCIFCKSPIFHIDEEDIFESNYIGSDSYPICVTCEENILPRYFYQKQGFADQFINTTTYISKIVLLEKLEKEVEELREFKDMKSGESLV